MTDRSRPPARPRVPRIADLVDLEGILEEDRERPIELLLARDARIGHEIDAARLDDRSLLLAWLERVRPSPDSPGRAVEGLLRLTALVLVVAGLGSGALAVAGWLWTDAATPVNVVQLWPALVGVQLVLAFAWVAVRLASGWLARTVDDGLSTWLPAAFGALATRLARPALRDAWRRFRTLDRVYGGIRFWRVTQLTQSFAVAFNLGALAALLFIPTVDDPAFGWRSRLLDASELATVATVIATPWSAFWPEGLPSPSEIEATEASSLAPEAGLPDSGRSPVWAAWWPFLVASFVAYGLLPRLALRLAAGWRTRRLLRGVAFDHEACLRLRARLRRPLVDGSGRGEETAGLLEGGEEPAFEALELPGRVRVVRWAGIPLDDETLSLRLAGLHGAVVDGVETVGGLDLHADEVALEALRDAPAVVVVVEAWEAPSADYLDFLRRLRGSLGERVPLVVLPCEMDVDRRPTLVEPRHLSLWRRRLAALSDPWLRVDPFPAQGSA